MKTNEHLNTTTFPFQSGLKTQNTPNCAYTDESINFPSHFLNMVDNHDSIQNRFKIAELSRLSVMREEEFQNLKKVFQLTTFIYTT